MLLKAALYLSGDRTYEAELKPDLSQITTNRRNSWSFYSDLRRRAMTLAVISSIFARARRRGAGRAGRRRAQAQEPLVQHAGASLGADRARYAPWLTG